MRGSTVPGAYDWIIGTQLDDLAVDGSQHKASVGGEGTGPSRTDRGKIGWEWSLAADRNCPPLALLRHVSRGGRAVTSCAPCPNEGCIG